MQVDDCYQLGYILKPHGLNGMISIFLDVDNPENYQKMESVFIEINGKLIPFFIAEINIKKNKAVVRLEDIMDLSAAEALKGKSIYLPLADLPPLDGNNFYFHEVIGYQVIDKHTGSIGKITTVYTLPNQNLLAVDHQGTEILIPVNDYIIVNVDRSNEEMMVSLPSGLLEVYMN